MLASLLGALIFFFFFFFLYYRIGNLVVGCQEASMQFLLELHHLHEQCVTGVNDILPQANLADRSADLIEVY
jgi:hypothetical protein